MTINNYKKIIKKLAFFDLLFSHTIFVSLEKENM